VLRYRFSEDSAVFGNSDRTCSLARECNAQLVEDWDSQFEIERLKWNLRLVFGGFLLNNSQYGIPGVAGFVICVIVPRFVLLFFPRWNLNRNDDKSLIKINS
jgi:hypothetical protein